MHIILVSNRLATAKTFLITPRFITLAILAFFLATFSVSALFSWLSVQFRLPFLEHWVISANQHNNLRAEAYLKDNLNAMATRLGQMQAQLMYLDSLSERVSALSGLQTPENLQETKKIKQGRGGPLLLAQPQTESEWSVALDRLARHIEHRTDSLTALEQQLLEERMRKSLLPRSHPIPGANMGSGFGWRTDPVTGVSAMHEGMDFQADIGTTVTAAAGGVVATADIHPQYGNLIEIEHGNGFSTRYAHLSKILVKSGQVLRRGETIGLSGNTGRSTGPHLHFEVRFQGVAQNPSRFLATEKERSFKELAQKP